jgi:hypothetical protein
MAIGTMGIGATATTVTAAIGPVTHIADGTNPVGASFQIRRASSSTRDEGVGFDRRPVPLKLRGGSDKAKDIEAEDIETRAKGR